MTEVPCIVFDCNETLLDLETMTPIFERLFEDKSAMRVWFQNLITYSQALTITDHYEPFTDIGGAVLQMMADARKVRISFEDRRELTDKFATVFQKKRAGRSPLSLTVTGTCRVLLQWRILHVHATHSTHAAARRAMSMLFVLGRLSDHDLCCE